MTCWGRRIASFFRHRASVTYRNTYPVLHCRMRDRSVCSRIPSGSPKTYYAAFFVLVVFKDKTHPHALAGTFRRWRKSRRTHGRRCRPDYTRLYRPVQQLINCASFLHIPWFGSQRRAETWEATIGFSWFVLQVVEIKKRVESQWACGSLRTPRSFNGAFVVLL